MRGVEALETVFARYLPQLVVAVVRGLPTLRAFNRGEEQAERIEQVSDRYRRAAMGTLRIAFPSETVLELATTLGVAPLADRVVASAASTRARARRRSGSTSPVLSAPSVFFATQVSSRRAAANDETCGERTREEMAVGHSHLV